MTFVFARSKNGLFVNIDVRKYHSFESSDLGSKVKLGSDFMAFTLTVLPQNVSFHPLIVFVLTEFDDAVPLPIIG